MLFVVCEVDERFKARKHLEVLGGSLRSPGCLSSPGCRDGETVAAEKNQRERKNTPSSALKKKLKKIKAYRLCLPLRFISFSHSAALALILPFPRLHSAAAVPLRGVDLIEFFSLSLPTSSRL